MRDSRDVLDGILWVLRTGAPWDDLPERYRPCFLLGRSPGPEYPAQVESLARSVPSVLDIHYLRAEYTGPESVDAGMNIVVRRGTPVAEADRMAEEVRGRLHSGAASS